MGLPVSGVVGELDVTLDIYNTSLVLAYWFATSLLLTDIDVRQTGQVQCSTNNICCPLREDDMTTVVALLDGSQDIRRVISLHVIVALDVAVAIPRRRLWKCGVGMVGLEFNGRT